MCFIFHRSTLHMILILYLTFYCSIWYMKCFWLLDLVWVYLLKAHIVVFLLNKSGEKREKRILQWIHSKGLSIFLWFLLFCLFFPMTSLYFHAVRATSFIWPDGFDYTNKIYVLYAIACVLGIVLLKKKQTKAHNERQNESEKSAPKDNNTHGAYYITWLKFFEP